MEGSMVFDNDKLVLEIQSGGESEDEAIAKAELKELFNQELCDDLLEDSEEEEDSSFYSPPPPPQSNATALGYQSVLPVDVFNGTSQAYTEGDDTFNGVTGTHYNHLGRSQLETLYYSKCNQMKQMEEQINAFQEETEKKLGTLRHLNRQLEADKLALMEELESQRHVGDELNKKVIENKDLSQKMEQMQKEKDELLLQLDSAQKTIQSLSLQVTELSQTDSIQRLRLSYEAAFEELRKQHEIELSNLASHNSGTTSSSPIPEAAPINVKNSISKEESTSSNGSLVEKEHVTDANGHSSQLEKERRELIAQVEDLTTQLLFQQERVMQAEESVQQLQLVLDNTKAENEKACKDYRSHINRLEEQLDCQQAVSEAKLKTSLEQCRQACLKLHEDSSRRLKEEFSNEKSKIEHIHFVDLEKLRYRIDSAIAAARKLWISEQDKRTNELIQLSLKQVQEKHSSTLKKLVQEKGEVIQLLDISNQEKLKLEQDFKKTKEKLKKVMKRADKLEGVLKNFKEALPSFQKDLVELMASTLLAQEKWYTQHN
uniref:Uncharacterized protein n=1 Tax=Amphimedon queenslandica TaxID=400682 RepID=A0A1X7VVT6_AMPQE